jgi:hypothetical protein
LNPKYQIKSKISYIQNIFCNISKYLFVLKIRKSIFFAAAGAGAGGGGAGAAAGAFLTAITIVKKKKTAAF